MHQSVFAGLKDLANEIASHQLVSPTLIVIGKVVALSPLWPHVPREISTLVVGSR
ncbi:S-adenosyl-L-methionine-dependent uroporphyrinogen III methyltransferase, chloroplastic [Orobanche minor]